MDTTIGTHRASGRRAPHAGPATGDGAGQDLATVGRGPHDASPRLDSLTGLRFVAAAMVVVHHTVQNDVNAGYLVKLPFLRPLATLGFTGVSFFFVLSGFVLAWSSRPDSDRNFWSRRVARVYPLHAVTWLLAIPVLLYAGEHIGFGTAVLCLFLLQAWSPNSDVVFGMNSLSWSLSCEAFFYACFPFLHRRIAPLSLRGLRRVVGGCAAILLIAPAVAFGLGGRSAVAIFYYFPAYRVFEFIIGICLAVAIRGGWRPRVPAWVGPAAVVLTVALAVLAGDLYRRAGGGDALPRPVSALMMLPSFVLLIVTAACRDLRGRRSMFSGAVLVRLGVWSFALYMTHHLVLAAVESGLGSTRPVSPIADVLTEIVALIVAVALSGLAFRTVEDPAERRLRRALTAR